MRKIKINNIKNFIKNNPAAVVLSVLLIFLSCFFKNPLFAILLVYGFFIKLLVSKHFNNRIKKKIATTIWSIFVILFCIGIYVNWVLPHGPSYPTGEVVCKYDDRGPCVEQYVEDMRNLNIPDWARFLRKNSNLLLIGLAFAGFCAKPEEDL